MTESRQNCELCNAEASVYCASDAAHLCWTCDAKVHNANFLVARHIRSIICSGCQNPADYRLSGAGIPPSARILFRSCSPADFDDDDDSLSSSSSSCCVSSTTEESASRKRRERKTVAGGGGTVAMDLKVEGVLVNWCRRISIDDRRSRQVVSTVVELLGGCLGKLTMLPFRVCLATSFWVAMSICRLGSDTCRDLRRLEQISGVPAKLILATESRLARALNRRRSRENHEEGWAEC